MDIDAALERLRQLAAADPDSEFAIAFEALDGWLSRGGFFPAAWRNPDPRVRDEAVTLRFPGFPPIKGAGPVITAVENDT